MEYNNAMNGFAKEYAVALLQKLNLFFENHKDISAIKIDLDEKGRRDCVELLRSVSDNTELLDIYKKGHLYTKLINNIVLPYLLRMWGMETSNEYYRIDLIGYRKGTINDSFVQRGKELGLIPYCWGFDYAIEHENARGKWIDEAIKLAYINCPMRVIIGYNRPIKSNEKQDAYNTACLEYLIECIEQANIPKADNTALVVLFGIRDEKGAWKHIKYEGYVVDYGTKTIEKL